MAWMVALLVGLAGSPTWAHGEEALTPAAITEFELKLGAARAAQAVVTGRIACFERQDRDLVLERDADQRRLGELVSHKRDLESLLVQQRSEYEGFSREYNEGRRQVQTIQNELEKLRAYKAAKEEALRICKRQWGFMGFMCDLSMEIAQATGMIQKNDHQIAVAQSRVVAAEAGMRQAEARLRQSEAALARSQEDAARTQEEIRVAEASISRLQATLSTLRPEFHNNKLLLDDFASALDEAKSVDTADGRARTARMVRTLAVRVDQSTRQSDALVAQARTVLTEQQFAVCFR
jgi:chromosome segregation ATPase